MSRSTHTISHDHARVRRHRSSQNGSGRRCRPSFRDGVLRIGDMRSSSLRSISSRSCERGVWIRICASACDLAPRDCAWIFFSHSTIFRPEFGCSAVRSRHRRTSLRPRNVVGRRACAAGYECEIAKRRLAAGVQPRVSVTSVATRSNTAAGTAVELSTRATTTSSNCCSCCGPRCWGLFSTASRRRLGRTRFRGRKPGALPSNQRWLHTAGRLSWVMAWCCLARRHLPFDDPPVLPLGSLRRFDRFDRCQVAASVEVDTGKSHTTERGRRTPKTGLVDRVRRIGRCLRWICPRRRSRPWCDSRRRLVRRCRQPRSSCSHQDPARRLLRQSMSRTRQRYVGLVRRRSGFARKRPRASSPSNRTARCTSATRHELAKSAVPPRNSTEPAPKSHSATLEACCVFSRLIRSSSMGASPAWHSTAHVHAEIALPRAHQASNVPQLRAAVLRVAEATPPCGHV
jgi:hypothetical protein